MQAIKDLRMCPSEKAKLPFILLKTGQKDIFLFHDIPQTAGESDVTKVQRTLPNTVYSRGPLKQLIPESMDHLNWLERLDMIHQIPELGVVVVGNHVGRVGIFTITYWKLQKQSGFRLEVILPYKSQERDGERPRVALLGTAVAPVQGYQLPNPNGKDDDETGDGVNAQPVPKVLKRRFRLLMVYVDHTVLSFEIYRRGEHEEIAVI